MGERGYFRSLTKLAVVESGLYPKIIHKPMLERYFECERQAKSDIYILMDDDCIPATSQTLIELVALLKRRPDISQLGLGWQQSMESERGSAWKLAELDEDVWEFDHCGGIMAIRKGTIKDLGFKTDYENGIGDDKVMGKTARELGYKVGIAHKLWFHHLGAGKDLSTVWK